jgi:hypothetical protein
MAKKKTIPTEHKAKLGDIVKFKHAGRWRCGEVIELTIDTDGHATYTCTTSGSRIIYPRLGLNGSKWEGYIHVEE